MSDVFTEGCLQLERRVRSLYRAYGPGKPMALPIDNPRRPYYFLHRNFAGSQDLLIIFNAPSCRYHCNFCSLSSRKSLSTISVADVLMQFEFALKEVKHSLGVLDRLTLSNDGSILDPCTFAVDALSPIVRCSAQLKNIEKIVLETRLEFIDPATIRGLQKGNPNARICILTGFETHDPQIRDRVLGKQQTLETFLRGLDTVAASEAELAAFVLYKPDYHMTDEDAYEEARASIDFLVNECAGRQIPLTVRLNPMYAARDSEWARCAQVDSHYEPPRLTDVLSLAENMRHRGLDIYIGLSTEGIADPKSCYLAREDYSKDLLRRAIEFNYRKAARK